MDTISDKAKRSYIALGLMSGTSLDGVDAAFLQTDGERILRVGPHLSEAFSAEERAALNAATQAALDWQFSGPMPNNFAQAETIIHQTHLAAIAALCAQAPDWAAKLDVIGFHGQTVLHHPPKAGQKGQTLQLGDGQRLADAIGKPVIFDFRTQDMQAGGQGAPLAPAYHKALVALADITDPVAVLNLGGVGNITRVEPIGSSEHKSEHKSERGSGRGHQNTVNILASDTGPGNGLLDNWMRRSGMGDYDPGGRYSCAGDPDFAIIDRWLSQDFFTRPLPRSADRYEFTGLEDLVDMSVEDGAATLSAFTALSVRRTLAQLPVMPSLLIICGGGRHNQAMSWMLAEHLPDMQIETADTYGWASDAIEAQAFAFLAVRSHLGLPLSYPRTTGVNAPCLGGRKVLPQASN